MRLDNLFGVEA